MTRKESHALLKEMRETESSVVLKDAKGWEIVVTNLDDELKFEGHGRFTIKNTFADFYYWVREYTFVRMYHEEYFDLVNP